MGLLAIAIAALLWLAFTATVIAVCGAAARADRRDRAPGERIVSRA